MTGRGDVKLEHRVHANQRRQVGEAQSEVRPQAHGAIKLGVIAERFKLSRVSRVCSRLSCHTILSTPGGREFWVALSLLGNICSPFGVLCGAPCTSVSPLGVPCGALCTSVYPVVHAFCGNSIRAPSLTVRCYWVGNSPTWRMTVATS